MEEDDENNQQEGGGAAVSVFFFKSMVQAVLIFGSENWTVTPYMGRELGGFQDQVAQRLTELLPQQKLTGSGSTTGWRQQGRRRGSRQWRSTFDNEITWSHNTSLRNY